jgi:hypothetical protein
MTVTLTHPTTSLRPAAARSGTASLWRAGLAAAAAAAVATTGVVVTARALDVAVQTQPGQPIPLAGFAQMTVLFTVVGIVIARAMRRRAARPRATFGRTVLILTALSVLPDLLLSTDGGSKVTLVMTHLVAAAIVIPVLLARLPEARGASAAS